MIIPGRQLMKFMQTFFTFVNLNGPGDIAASLGLVMLDFKFPLPALFDVHIRLVEFELRLCDGKQSEQNTANKTRRTKQSEQNKANKTKRTKQNKTKQNKTKQNKTKQNKTK